MGKKLEDLKSLVLNEAYNLKKYASKDELNLLNFESLMPAFATNCIYGQMTGSCYTERALELLRACAIPFVSLVIDQYHPSSRRVFAHKRARHYSAIEAYIFWNRFTFDDKNKILISFLKDEIKELTIEML